MHHEQARCETAGLEKALHGPAPREGVGIDTDATLLRAPPDHVVGHRLPTPCRRTSGSTYKSCTDPTRSPSAKSNRRQVPYPTTLLPPPAAGAPAAAAVAAAAPAAVAKIEGALSAVHSPIQRPDDDQLSRICELPAERALQRSITPVQADEDSAAPHGAQLAHRGGVQLDQAPDVAFKGKPGAS